MGAIEILAGICILLGVVKLLVLAFSPKSWLKFAKSFYKSPELSSWIALVLAAIVLYVLVGAGISIVEIFAVMLFVALLMWMSLAYYGTELVKIAEHRLKDLWSKHLLSVIVWLLLLIWGIKELFF